MRHLFSPLFLSYFGVQCLSFYLGVTNEMHTVYVKERDKAFLSLDKKKIMRFCRKWHLCMPDNELVFWCGVHKVVANTASATEEQRAKSVAWLIEHGFSPEIYRQEER